MNKSVTEIFNIRLKQIMRSCKLKNTDIARAMNKDNQIVWNYFHNTTKPAWADTCNLIEFLQNRIGNIDLNFLFGNYNDNDLLAKINKLQDELSNLKKAYNNLVIEYVILNNNMKVQRHLNKKERSNKDDLQIN